MSVTIVPYQSTYDAAVQKLEASVVQGNQIKLRIVKDHFLDRSVAFETYFPCVAIDDDKQVIGTSAGAYTDLIINGKQFKSGFVFDVKVLPAYRNQGVGRTVTSYFKSLFTKGGLEKNFTTLKLSNTPVVKMATRALKNIWLYDFVYLTIPTAQKVEKQGLIHSDTRFSVRLFDESKVSPTYYSHFAGGLGCFYTYMLYRLRIEKLSWLYRKGLKLLKVMNPSKYALLPKEREEMLFATLFDYSKENIYHINDVLKGLRERGISYLLVCCRPKDAIY
ncbi:MAG: GNAT family N-acetyltransferase, partial [Flavisolibacter sp.]